MRLTVGIYCIYDRQAKIYNCPHVCDNDNVAKRQLCLALLEKPDGPMGRFPEDFALYRVGDFDTTTGEVSGTIPERVCTAEDMLNRLNVMEGGNNE